MEELKKTGYFLLWRSARTALLRLSKLEKDFKLRQVNKQMLHFAHSCYS